MFGTSPTGSESTAARAAKDFDLLSSLNGYPEVFSVFEGEILHFRLARKPAHILPLPKLLVRALWRSKFGAALRQRILNSATCAVHTTRRPGSLLRQIDIRDPISGMVISTHEPRELIKILEEMPADYKDSGAAYTSRVPLETIRWSPGIYEGVFRDDGGRTSEDIYVNVKPRTMQDSDLLCILPTFTWQAYNRIGGGSFYSPELGHKRTISSQRPMHHSGDNSIQPALALLSVFRKEGVRVASVDSWDLHQGRLPVGQALVAAILVHDEYWSVPMRAQMNNLLDQGGSLLVIGGNTCWWQIDAEWPNISVDKQRDRKTLWHRNGPPEEQTFVSSYRFGGYAIERARRKARLTPRVAHLSKEQIYEAGAIKVTDSAHPIFDGISLPPDCSFGHKVPLMYREIDAVPLDGHGSVDRATYKAGGIEPHILATGLTLYGHTLRDTAVVVEAQVRNGYVLHMGSIGWARGVWQKNEQVIKVVVNAYRHCLAMARRSAG